MQVNQIQNFIEHASADQGYKIVVTFLNSSCFYGFFVRFNDWKRLKERNKWRFIPINKFNEFNYELRKTKIQNPDYSIIIDGDVISNLETERFYSLS
jgi:hypothetical protein